MFGTSYPPPTLSKLIIGHEPFAPVERIVDDDDGLRNIAPNISRVQEAWNEVGCVDLVSFDSKFKGNRCPDVFI